MKLGINENECLWWVHTQKMIRMLSKEIKSQTALAQVLFFELLSVVQIDILWTRSLLQQKKEMLSRLINTGKRCQSHWNYNGVTPGIQVLGPSLADFIRFVFRISSIELEYSRWSNLFDRLRLWFEPLLTRTSWAIRVRPSNFWDPEKYFPKKGLWEKISASDKAIHSELLVVMAPANEFENMRGEASFIQFSQSEATAGGI